MTMTAAVAPRPPIDIKAPDTHPNFPKQVHPTETDPISQTAFFMLFDRARRVLTPAYVIAVGKISPASPAEPPTYQIYDWAYLRRYLNDLHTRDISPLDPVSKRRIESLSLFFRKCFRLHSDGVKVLPWQSRPFVPFGLTQTDIKQRIEKLMRRHDEYTKNKQSECENTESRLYAIQRAQEMDKLPKTDAARQEMVERFWKFGLPGSDYLRQDEDREEWRKDQMIGANLWQELQYKRANLWSWCADADVRNKENIKDVP
jgi:hypothetical protein